MARVRADRWVAKSSLNTPGSVRPSLRADACLRSKPCTLPVVAHAGDSPPPLASGASGACGACGQRTSWRRPEELTLDAPEDKAVTTLYLGGPGDLEGKPRGLCDKRAQSVLLRCSS